MNKVLPLALMAAAMLFVGTVNAQSSDKSHEGAKCEGCPASAAKLAIAGDCDGQCESGSCSHGCPVTAAMEKLPKMTYRVGTEDTCCAESAAKLAKENEAPITYVVGDKTFEDKTEAYTSLVEQTETMVNDFITPKKCSESGCTTVAGKSCSCSVEAGKNVELVQAAVKDLKMSYTVGKEECNCPMKAAELAKTSGEEMHYVVGEEDTCCSMTARLNLAKAKYKAAVQALASAQKPAAETTAATTEAVGS